MEPIKKEDFKIVFMGTGGEVSIAALDAIVKYGVQVVGIVDNYKRVKRVTSFDRYVRKHSLLMRYAKLHQIPYIGSDDINADVIENWIKNSECNLICICSAFQLMKNNIIDIPKYGVINAHGALLPAYRGPNPTYWVFRNIEEYGGATLHFVDSGEDTGDIIVQRKFEIPFGASMDYYKQLQLECIEDCYSRGLQLLITGCNPTKQSEVIGPKARNVKREDYLLNYENWEVRKAYHFLNGTGAVNIIYDSIVSNCKIIGFTETNIKPHGKFNIKCKNGYVLVERNFISLNSFLKIIVKGIMKRI